MPTVKRSSRQGMICAGMLCIPFFLHAAHSFVTVSGRQLVVNGQTFSIKGVNYSPIPEGSAGDGTPGCLDDSQWWTNQATYVADFPLIHQLGANTIRTYSTMNDVSAGNIALVRAMLDKAQANGLYVIMAYYPPHTVIAAATPVNTTNLVSSEPTRKGLG